jgi:plasmid stabilization system protein ParE
VRIKSLKGAFFNPMIQIPRIFVACCRVILFLMAMGIAWSPAQAVPGNTDTPFPPAIMSSLRLARPQHFCGEPVPMNNPEVRERFEREFLLSVWNEPQVILWLKRSKRYFTIVEPMLKSAGLPDDLKYVAVAESALRPHAGSRQGAMGFWQFMPSTGRKYGLTIDSLKDERRNIFRSTEAAVRYFKELREEFGSWTLAAAAYNMGEQGLMSEILEQRTDNYYELYLPLETQGFLFRILAIKLIMTQPETFGFDLKSGDYYPPLTFDRVRIDCAVEMPIRLVAQAAKTQFKVIKDLNPEIRGYYLARGVHDILVPKGAAAGFQKRLAALVTQSASGQASRTYIVQKGDTLTSIAAKFEVPLPALIIWNRIDLSRPIHPGDRLVIRPGQ